MFDGSSDPVGDDEEVGAAGGEFYHRALCPEGNPRGEGELKTNGGAIWHGLRDTELTERWIISASELSRVISRLV
jgi:hypothetical protein